MKKRKKFIGIIGGIVVLGAVICSVARASTDYDTQTLFTAEQISKFEKQKIPTKYQGVFYQWNPSVKAYQTLIITKNSVEIKSENKAANLKMDVKYGGPQFGLIQGHSEVILANFQKVGKKYQAKDYAELKLMNTGDGVNCDTTQVSGSQDYFKTKKTTKVSYPSLNKTFLTEHNSDKSALYTNQMPNMSGTIYRVYFNQGLSTMRIENVDENFKGTTYQINAYDIKGSFIDLQVSYKDKQNQTVTGSVQLRYAEYNESPDIDGNEKAIEFTKVDIKDDLFKGLLNRYFS
jgi:hypothetical protein